MWLIVLALVGCIVYLNHVGLPEFVKNPLLEKLRARGIDLQFTRLRVRWYQGIVAENVRFGRAADPLSPRLTAAEVQLQFNHEALKKFQFQLDSLVLREGRLVWPVPETNRPARQLSVDHIQTDLRLLPNDQWALDNFRASFAGGNIQVAGSVTNASAVREWKLFQGEQPSQPGALQDRLRRLADSLERTHFSSPPSLRLDIQGDARDPQSFLLRLRLAAPGSETPWGNFTRGLFFARLFPATNGLIRAELNLEAAEAQTPWAATTNLQVTIHLSSVPGQTNLVSGDLALAARVAETKWGGATNAQFSAHWVHALTNPIPLSGQCQFRCAAAQTHWARGSNIDLTARLREPTNNVPVDQPSSLLRSQSPFWAWWTNLEPYALDWECHVTDLRSAKLGLDELAFNGTWRAPNLTLVIPQAKLYGGESAARAALNVDTRALNVTLASDCDPHKVSLLTEGAHRWLEQFSWNQSPELAAELSLVLPFWTNGPPDWRAEVLPTLQIQGQFKVDHGGAFRGVPVTSARSHVVYSNMWWHLPDLVLDRPEGRAEVIHAADDRTKDFYWKIHSDIDVRSIRPLLETNQQRHLDEITFAQPPVIEAEVWGRWHHPELTGLKAQVVVTNFSFRGEHADQFQTGLQYTNRFLRLTNACAFIGTQQLSAGSLAIDFIKQRIYVTNGFSSADPRIVTRAIGPKVDRTIEPYHFGQPPIVRVNGIIPVQHEQDADLHFDFDGGSFHWLQFNVPRISGQVIWKGPYLSLNDVRGDFYGGEVSGSATFDFRARSGADFHFDLAITNTQLKALMADLSTHTNNLEGILSGSVLITGANSTDWDTWQGAGDVDLHDGLIWDIPVFGVFSPILNGIAPGLGNSRASAGTGSFIITNSVIFSDDLEFRTSGTRLLYRGSVDFRGQVNARVEAELLRDVWVVGPLISTVFWPVAKLFEYKVTGSLSQPKTEPLYFIPKIMLLPFHPLRTLKELFPEAPSSTTTNAPPPPP